MRSGNNSMIYAIGKFDGKNKSDIKSKISQARQAFYKKRNLFTTHNISLKINKTFIKSFEWSVTLYDQL